LGIRGITPFSGTLIAEVSVVPDERNFKTGELTMLITKKMLLAVTLVAALVGGGLGSLITHSANRTEAANDNYQTTANAAPVNSNPEKKFKRRPTLLNSAHQAEQTAYKEGFSGRLQLVASAVNNGQLSNMRRDQRIIRRLAPHGSSFFEQHADALITITTLRRTGRTSGRSTAIS
jgi:hypothetical protein